MANLGDYLGQLMSEIAMARLQADLETVRLAELYASHPLLRTMPVPHMRLPDVDLEIPVLINTTEAPRNGETPRGGLPRAEMRKKVDAIVAGFVQKTGMQLPREMQAKLKAALDEKERLFLAAPETAIDVGRSADEFTSAALGVLKQLPPRAPAGGANGPQLDETTLKHDVRLAFLQARTPPPRLDVIVSSAQIREGATSDNVARIRLKIAEQGVEWVSLEKDGQTRDLLVPE